MQKKIILRLGLVGVVAAASGSSVFAVGCSGDDNTNTPPAADSGPDSTGFPDAQPGTDAAHDSATSDVDAAPPPPNAKLTLVHAAPGVPAFRVCFGLVNAGTTIVAPGYEPLPNNAANQGPFPYLGIFPGTGGTLADLGVNYSTLEIVGFIINADKIATHTSAEGTSEPQCSDLIGSDGSGPADAGAGALVLGTDYFKLPSIPKGTLTPGSSFILALEGCEPGNTSASAQAVCGAGYASATGNIALQLYKVDNSTPATTTLGAQVLHASSAWDGVTGGHLQQPIATTFGITDQAVDGGGGNAPIGTLLNFGSSVTPDAAAPQTITPADYAGLAAYATATAPDGGPLVTGFDPDGGAPILGTITAGFTFPQIQSLSGYGTAADGGPADPLYLPGKNFVLVWVGDPSQPELIDPTTGQQAVDGGPSAFNTAYLHFLMFPTDPPLPASN